MVNSPQDEKMSVKQKLEVAEQKVYSNIKDLSQREDTNGATEEEGKKEDFLKLEVSLRTFPQLIFYIIYLLIIMLYSVHMYFEHKVSLQQEALTHNSIL